MERAIVNDVRTNRKLTAVCEVWTYDVWGNARDGWDVNDRNCIHRKWDAPAVCCVSNLPRYPGARDEHRAFPADSASFTAEVCVSFELPDSSVREALGIDPRVKIEIEGDGTRYDVTRSRDGYPLGEILINEWKE